MVSGTFRVSLCSLCLCGCHPEPVEGSPLRHGGAQRIKTGKAPPSQTKTKHKSIVNLGFNLESSIANRELLLCVSL